ncbi:MAG: iron transporter [Natrialbaceae archaeon]|nr:iron transporter [Natrialbaceae archaeon]
MAFHYGDNVRLPEAGEYTAQITIGPPTASLSGQLAGLLESPVTREITFEYQPADIHGLTFDLVDEGRRGSRGALPLMDHQHAPLSKGQPVADLSGQLLGEDSSGDAAISVLFQEPSPLAESGHYLAVLMRTPYNDVPLPGAILSLETVEGTHELEERIDPSLGHHYGTAVSSIPDSVEITVETPPPVARHDGYETAFLSFDPIDIST